MSSRGGLLWRLRDESLSWEDRVKLARYAWKMEHIYFPNKEQALLDWLCLSLAGKKRVSISESGPVWRCLHDVLKTKKCHLATKLGQPLMLKAAMYQVLLEEIQNIAKKGEKGTTENDDVIISCCHSIMMSASMGSSFTTKFEFMLPLLSSLLDMCCTEMATNGQISQMMMELTQQTLGKYTACQKAKGNPQQITLHVSSKLLVPAMRFLYVMRHGATSGLRELHTGLVSTLNAAFFSRELLVHYETYLKIKTGHKVETASVPPKFIECIFNQIVTLLKKKESADCVHHYLSHFYAGFLHQYRSSGNEMCFRLLMHLCDILSVKLTSTTDAQSCITSETDTILNVLQGLLQQTTESDVYNAADDQLMGGCFLKWLKSLMDWYLELDTRSVAWYTGVRYLLKINHSSITDLSTLLDRAWVDISQSSDANPLAACGELLSDLALTYHQLRQMKTFIMTLVKQISQRKHTEHLKWPAALTESLRSCVSELPQSVVVQIWTEILAHMKDVYVSATGYNSASLASACHMFSVFLRNMSVADYNITPHTAARVDELMGDTAKDIISPLVEYTCMKNTNLWSALYLAWSWAELHLVLKQFTTYDSKNNLEMKTSLAAADMRLVYGDLISGATWSQVQKHATSFGNGRTGYLWQCLLVQKLKAILLAGDHATETDTANIASLLVTLTSNLMPEHRHDGDLKQSWDGQIMSVSEDNHQVACWTLVCDSLPLIAPWCQPDQLQHITDYLLWTLMSQTEKQCENIKKTLTSVSLELLKRSELQEVFSLQTALVTSALHAAGDLLTTHTSPAKKQKSSRGSVGKVLLQLSDENDIWHSGDAQQSLARLQSVGKSLEHVLSAKASNVNLTLGQQQALVQCVKALEIQPVEFFNPTNKMRCVMEALLLLAVKVDKNQKEQLQTSQNQSELKETSLKLIELALDGQKINNLFHLVHCGDLLKWLHKIEYPVHNGPTHERVMRGLLKLALREEDTTEHLSSFMEHLTQVLSENKKQFSSSPEHATRVIHTTVLVTQVLNKILSQSSTKTEVKSAGEEFLNKLLKSLTKLSHFLLTKGEAYLSDPSLRCHVLLGASVRVDHTCSRAADDVQDLAQDLPALCDLCLTAMSQHKMSRFTQNTFIFINTLCTHREKLQSVLPENFFKKVWQQLWTMFSEQFHSSRISKGSCDQSNLMKINTQPMRIESDMEVTNEQQDITTTNQEQDDIMTNDKSELKERLEHCMRCVLVTLDTEDFHLTVTKLLSDVTVSVMQTEPRRVLVAMEIWRKMLEMMLNDATYTVLHHASQTFLLKLQHIAMTLSQTNHPQGHELIMAAMATQQHMVAMGKSLLSCPQMSLVLHSCHYVPVDGSTLKVYVANFRCIYDVMNTLLVSCPETVLDRIPPYVQLISRLMGSVIERCGAGTTYTDQEAEELAHCAHCVDRLCNLLTNYKAEFSKVAVYLVADYVNQVQKVTLLPKVKKSLLPGIYTLLDLCDQHAIALLHAVLHPGVKDVFKALYSDYTKHHKYTGKI